MALTASPPRTWTTLRSRPRRTRKQRQRRRRRWWRPPSRWSTQRSAGCATSGLRRSRCAETLSRTATSARTMRRARPAVRGREGASARGARTAMLACHEAPSMAGHTLVSFALELSVYACMCVYIVCMYALSIVRSFARKLSAVITKATELALTNSAGPTALGLCCMCAVQ